MRSYAQVTPVCPVDVPTMSRVISVQKSSPSVKIPMVEPGIEPGTS